MNDVHESDLAGIGASKSPVNHLAHGRLLREPAADLPDERSHKNPVNPRTEKYFCFSGYKNRV
jgi:hypothetical protein